MNEKLAISKKEMSERLYVLNQAIKDLTAQEQDDDTIKQRVEELYELKERVLIKLLTEGYIRVRNKRPLFGCYVFRLNRTYTFHVLARKVSRELVREHGRKKIKRLNTSP